MTYNKHSTCRHLKLSKLQKFTILDKPKYHDNYPPLSTTQQQSGSYALLPLKLQSQRFSHGKILKRLDQPQKKLMQSSLKKYNLLKSA